ncbi:hypothetical protein GBA52_023765 [Prunus armeniaca]|nr:hypothetical protein GBA52_023765 [Prunus armeniaca]
MFLRKNSEVEMILKKQCTTETVAVTIQIQKHSAIQTSLLFCVNCSQGEQVVPVSAAEPDWRPTPLTKLFVSGDSYSATGNDWDPENICWRYPYGTTFPGKPMAVTPMVFNNIMYMSDE